MSETTVALVITLLLLAATALWVPFLHLCCRCKDSLSRPTRPTRNNVTASIRNEAR